MSAKEDASSTSPAHRPRRPSTAVVFVFVLAGAALGALLAQRFVPSRLELGPGGWSAAREWSGGPPLAVEWPRAPHPGESAVVEARRAGERLVVTAPAREVAESLADGLARRRRSARATIEETRERLRAQLREELVIGPLPPIDPAAQCVALLRGWSRAAHALARPSADRSEPPALPAAEEAAVQAATAAADPRGLEAALARVRASELARIGADARALQVFSPESVLQRWAAALSARADAFDALATTVETGFTEAQRELVDLHAAPLALALEPRVPDPAEALMAAPLPPAVVTKVHAPRTLAAVAGGGGLLGGLLGLLVGLPFARALARRRREPTDLPAAAPSGDGGEAWLHLVSGPDRVRIAHGVAELAARSAAAGQRTLVLEGGPRLRLHELFGAQARLGLAECLEQRQSALGYAQHGGVPGLLYLANGATGGIAWVELDRVLEELRPHFGRVILALPREVPFELGSVLAGRVMDGWWADRAGSREGALRSISSRLGIRFRHMVLERSPKPSLEALVRSFEGALPLATPATLAAPPAPAVVAPEPPAPRLPPASVLDPDLQVRERLRFLAWMRRIQAERRQEVVETAGPR
jgi:hypothetical protein